MTEQNMVKALISSGLKEFEIAKRIGKSQPSVNKIRHGRSTSYAAGKQLEALCAERGIDVDRDDLLKSA